MGGGLGGDNGSPGGVDGRAALPFFAGMDTDETPQAGTPPAAPRPAKAQAKADRLAREAAALRSNLRKRKDQARQRDEPAAPPKSE